MATNLNSRINPVTSLRNDLHKSLRRLNHNIRRERQIFHSAVCSHDTFCESLVLMDESDISLLSKSKL